MKIIKFKQSVCEPCKILDNILANDLKVDADKVINLDSGDDEGLMLAGQYGVMSTPTLILLDDNGDIISRVVGINRDGIKSMFAQRGLI